MLHVNYARLLRARALPFTYYRCLRKPLVVVLSHRSPLRRSTPRSFAFILSPPPCLPLFSIAGRLAFARGGILLCYNRESAIANATPQFLLCSSLDEAIGKSLINRLTLARLRLAFFSFFFFFSSLSPSSSSSSNVVGRESL